MHKLYGIGLMFLLTACGPNFQNIGNIGKESDPTRFYTLAVQAEQPEGQQALPHLMLGVGPVTVADYLDRSHIVVRKSATRLELAEFDRWAGALAKEIQRVLAADLATQLGTERILAYPWQSETTPDMIVEVAVEQFEYDEDGKARLVAFWKAFDEDEGTVVDFRRSTLEKESSKDYESISSALSGLVNALSKEMAATIRTQTQRGSR